MTPPKTREYPFSAGERPALDCHSLPKMRHYPRTTGQTRAYECLDGDDLVFSDRDRFLANSNHLNDPWGRQYGEPIAPVESAEQVPRE